MPGPRHDPTISKLFKWDTKKDPKGLKKSQPPKKIKEASVTPKESSKRISKKRRKRKVSILRSSPNRPTRRGSVQSGADASPSSRVPSSSPPRRAPVVPGLDLTPDASNVDTPTRRRDARRSRLFQCRNVNRGCIDNISFSSVEARNRHERVSCRALSQVKNSAYTSYCIEYSEFRIISGLFLTTPP